MNRKRKIIAVVLFAGCGGRFDSTTPKPFTYIARREMFTYTVDTFQNDPIVDEIYLVVDAQNRNLFVDRITALGFSKVKGLVNGGKTRQESSANAIAALVNANKDCKDDIVIIQDGDRPFMTHEMIRSTVREAELCGASMVAVQSVDSLFSNNGKKIKYIDRKTTWQAQTPQTFRMDVICRAIKKVGKKGEFTDDASMVIAIGGKVTVVPGDRNNMKITYLEDAKAAEAIVLKR